MCFKPSTAMRPAAPQLCHIKQPLFRLKHILGNNTYLQEQRLLPRAFLHSCTSQPVSNRIPALVSIALLCIQIVLPTMSAKLSALAEVDASGAFVRSASKFTHRIGSEQFPAVCGRYVLYVSRACPWACRTLSLLALKGLESVVPVIVVAPRWAPTKPQQDDHMGWVFRACALAGDRDLLEVPLTEPVFQANSIRAVYEAAEPDVQHVKVCCAPPSLDLSLHPSLHRSPT